MTTVPRSERCSLESSVISDPGIPTLAAIFDSAILENHLRSVLPEQCALVQDIRFHILKHHPGSRCTVEIALHTASGWEYAIGKVYASDRADVYRAMDAIRREGFGAADEYSIPKPLAYLSSLRLLLQEKVQGPRAKQVFLTGSEWDREQASKRCARWLAKFHTIAPLSGEVLDPNNEPHAIARWSRSIAKLGEPLASMVEELSERLLERVAAVRAGQLCAGHGSYNCNQIILAEGRTVAFDWDSYDVADPCRDVARFVVALQRLAFKYLGSFHALDGAIEIFLETYQELTPYQLTANLPWYRALTCLRLSKYEAHRPVCTFHDGIQALLAEGLRALAA